MTDAERNKTLLAAVGTAIAYLKEQGFNSAVICTSFYDAELDTTHTANDGFGDWYCRRGMLDAEYQNMREKDSRPIPIIDTTVRKESDQ